MNGAEMNESHSPGRPPWHLSTALLRDYAHLDLDVARSASVEQHLLACEVCRAALSSLSREDPGSAGRLDDLWLDVIDAVDRPRPGLVGSLLHRVGVPDHVTSVVAATPALRLSWIASIVVALAFAVANAMRPEGADAFLLIVAPLIPLAGIGTAYGPGTDPLHELTRAAPVAGSRIFLYRSVAVIFTALPLTLAAALVLRLDGLVAIGWLLPSLGLVGATMAMSTWVQPRLAAAAAAFGWLALLLAVWMRSARIDGSAIATTFFFRPAGQVMFAAIAVAGAAVFAARLEHLDQPDDVHLEAL